MRPAFWVGARLTIPQDWAGLPAIGSCRPNFEVRLTRISALPSEDVLLVAAWTDGMLEPVVFLQRFLSRAKGGFALVGAIVAQDQPEAELNRIADAFMEGVREHPKGHLWDSWHRSNN
jgi:hypothetical protein